MGGKPLFHYSSILDGFHFLGHTNKGLDVGTSCIPNITSNSDSTFSTPKSMTPPGGSCWQLWCHDLPCPHMLILLPPPPITMILHSLLPILSRAGIPSQMSVSWVLDQEAGSVVWPLSGVSWSEAGPHATSSQCYAFGHMPLCVSNSCFGKWRPQHAYLPGLLSREGQCSLSCSFIHSCVQCL